MKGHGGDIFDAGERLGIPAEELLDFSSNVNSLGPPAQAREILANSLQVVTRYPDIESRKLRRHLSDNLGVPPDRILAGNGSTELIYLLARRFAPRRATTFPPCYLDYWRASELAGAEVTGYVSTDEENFALAESALEMGSETADLVWLCNPNNPSGTLIDRDRIGAAAKTHPDVIFVVDEAFMEFVPDCKERSLIGTPEPNVIVLRSLTKFFALAGLRLGFLCADPEVVRHLASVREPWTVNGLAQAVGEHLYDDQDYISRTRAVVAEEREFLMRELTALGGLHPFPSHANFLLIRLDAPGLTSAGVKRQLLHQRILIRDACNFRGLDSRFFRVAVRVREDNVRLIEALRQALIPAEGQAASGAA